MLIAANRWNRVARPWFPWVPTVERILSYEPLEALDGPDINIFSDYGGQHKESNYATTGVLYMDMRASTPWLLGRDAWRKAYLPDGRRLGFKGLNDRHKQASLVPFLELASQISGLLLVVAVHKSLAQSGYASFLRPAIEARVKLKHHWRPMQFERMLQVSHLISLLIGGLGLAGQNTYWFSDEDELHANQAASQDLSDVLGLFSGNYIRHTMGQLGLGTTSVDEGDRYEEDCVAIPDLAVGAVAEALTTLRRRLGQLPTKVAVEYDVVFSKKTELLLNWFAYKGTRLRKLVIFFEPLSDGKFSVGKVDL